MLVRYVRTNRTFQGCQRCRRWSFGETWTIRSIKSWWSELNIWPSEGVFVSFPEIKICESLGICSKCACSKQEKPPGYAQLDPNAVLWWAARGQIRWHSQLLTLPCRLTSTSTVKWVIGRPRDNDALRSNPNQMRPAEQNYALQRSSVVANPWSWSRTTKLLSHISMWPLFNASKYTSALFPNDC
jgi:hypothetical protein